jgi:outer membrane protein assembly factor BamD (BamD/ComL family)
MLTKKISLFVLGAAFCCLFVTGCQTSRYQAGEAPSYAGATYDSALSGLQNGQGTAADDYRKVLEYPGRF